MKIKDLPLDSQPRQKLKTLGSESLSNAELLAIILRTGTKDQNVLDLSNKIIAKHGISNFFNFSIPQLTKIKGIGETKAMQLQTIHEISKRISQEKNPIQKIKGAQDVVDYFQFLKEKQEEHFYILMLNAKNNIIKSHLVSKGILDETIIHPREIFREAIKNSSARIILIHNHPSGDSNPSQEDLTINKTLKKIGEQIGIKVIDSVIIGKNEFWSWMNN